MSKLMLAEDGGFVLWSNGNAIASRGNVMEAVEYGTGGQNIWERMDFYGIPGARSFHHRRQPGDVFARIWRSQAR
ncbi:MAG: hypothetical protein R3B07_35370 [Polyangiaceae bacterium]